MKRTGRDRIARRKGWTKVVAPAAGWSSAAIQWASDYESDSQYCSTGFGKEWYFENAEIATLFKLKFG